MLRRKGRSADQRGAVIVEAALIFPLLFLIVFGSLEYGLLFKDQLTASNAVRAGGRALSAQSGKYADQAAIQAMLPAAASFNGGLSKVTRVVVYFATCANPTGPPTATASRCGASPPIKKLSQIAPGGLQCIPRARTVGVPDHCNIYAGDNLKDAFANNNGKWGCIDSPKSPDDWWCPETRTTSQSAGTDYVGVHIEYEHEWVTKLFGTKRDMADDVIFRVEPQGV